MRQSQEHMLSGHLPLVAILRGLAAENARAAGEALIRAGIGIIEVPLNRDGALDAIDVLARAFGGRALIGAGTVLDVPSLRAASAAGAHLIVSPNFNPQVVEAAVSAGLVAMPGVMTPTEAFGAIACGARHLKIFPAEATTPAALSALRAVLPPEMARLYPVGGVHAGNLAAWIKAGADGFGFGSALFKPEWAKEQISAAAAALVAAFKSAGGTQG